MINSFLLGVVQGVAEWLPVSSEAILTLFQAHVFQERTIFDMVRVALWLHMGTFFAALLYFRKEVRQVIITLFSYSKSSVAQQKLLEFLFFTTAISGVLGYGFLTLIKSEDINFLLDAKLVTILIGLLLLGTFMLLFLSKRRYGVRTIKDLSVLDYLILGVAQGFAALPGFSRSGLTVSMLLLRKVDDESSLRLSFLMSLPIVLAGNIVLNIQDLSFLNMNMLAGLIGSFIFGLLTIDILLRIARSIRFDLFVLLFGLITIAAGIIM